MVANCFSLMSCGAGACSERALPLPACGERVGVRGPLRGLGVRGGAPSPAALRSRSRVDLSPQAGRGEDNSYLQRWHVEPAPFGPALQAELGELHALGSLGEVMLPRRAGDHVADEILPLDLEAVVVGDVLRQLFPLVGEVHGLR